MKRKSALWLKRRYDVGMVPEEQEIEHLSTPASLEPPQDFSSLSFSSSAGFSNRQYARSVTEQQGSFFSK